MKVNTLRKLKIWRHARFRRYLEVVLSYQVVALVITVLCFVLFAYVATHVLNREADSINRGVLLYFQSVRTPLLTEVAVDLSALGSFVVIPFLSAQFVLLLLGNNDRKTALLFVILVAGAAILSPILKQVFGIMRPSLAPLQTETSYSFPSGHSLLSFTLYGGVAVWLVLKKPREWWRWVSAALLVFVAGLIALSRIYLGVHWPTDVIGGFLVAAMWISISSLLQIRLEHRHAVDSSLNP